ncbi:lycopene cyclase domain-containing protein [Catellatospora bangladeshensis]|uniref:Lycopene cyclase n=1 Tax=Catellatospora bangladeshensis TaxID=310355 RepID=A0A8J3JN77_9ACTN|nr:lycopene cyclase domain-containing protein [Catellatospora bangladeshensis]GIF81813.1 lycopene cyclase [Catellatospora bangladeshensis]
MGEYTVAAVAACLAVVGLELGVWRTGLLRSGRYWGTLAISLLFMVPVDGWLTRADATVVHYAPDAITGLRVPWDIPVEDYAFGYALITLTLLLWVRAGRGAADA